MAAGNKLGTKRQCPECAARFYDFDARPVVCVKCGVAVPLAAEKPRRKRKTDESPAPVLRKLPPSPAPEEDDETLEGVAPGTEALELEALDDEEVEVMSLEEVGEHEEEEETDAEGDDAEDEMFIEEEMAASGIVDDIRAYIETDEKIEEEEGEDAETSDEDSPPRGHGRKRG